MKAERSIPRATARAAVATASLLMIPLVAKLATDQFEWTAFDFGAAGVMIFGATLVYQLATRKAGTNVYRAAVGLGAFALLFLVWANLAVGIIGSEDNPANWMYVGVLAVAFVGTAIARFRPKPMANVMFATALAQMLITAIALASGMGGPESGPAEILAVNAMFVGLYAGSALLFRLAANKPV